MNDELGRIFGLDGRVAVITGAASGIGRGAALVFAAAGALVVLADVDAAGLAQTASQVAAAGGKALTKLTDVSVRGQVDALAEHALTQAGRIDVWANVAGVLVNMPVVEATEADLDKLLAINLKGTYWGCAAAVRAMEPRRSGSIINISSAGADAPAPGLSIYAMTKAAVNMLTRTLATEVGKQGIRVNTVAPGWVETPMVTYRFAGSDGDFDPAQREEVLRQRARISPLGLTGTPQDIALAMLYLASDASRFVTGQVIRPNGGAVMP